MDSHSIIYIFHSDTSEIANAAAANTALARDIHFVLTALVISDFNFKNVNKLSAFLISIHLRSPIHFQDFL